MVKASLAPASTAPSHSLPCVKGGGERSEPEGLPTQTMPGFISPSASRSLLQRRNLYGSPPRRSFCSYKRNQNTLGTVPQDPLTAKLRLDTNDALASSVQRRRYALKVPAAHFILDSAGTELKQTPYKRRRVGRNLRLSRADPALCSGQPSPLRCILLSPQGLATLRGPRLYGAYRRVGGLGVLPE